MWWQGGGGLAPDAAVDRVSRLCLVDLAGSERADKTGAAGVRLKESCRINQSLSVLGQVINALAEQAERNVAANKENGRGGGSSYIPYRDSTLTWLLSDSLGGNAKTVMMATISPSPLQFEETLSTLRYASNAKKIVTHARINADPKDRCIQDLLATIEDYKHRLALAEMASGGQQPSRPIAQPEEEEEEARRAVMLEREVSTLKIQNFARAKMLSKVKQQLAVAAAATHESAEEEAEVASLTAQTRRGAGSAATELPYLIRLGEEAPTGQEQAFYLASEQTHFDRDGCIINASGDDEEEESRGVAFSIDFQDGRLFASVPPGRRLWVNGSEIFFTKRSDAVCLEVWNGTRLALDPTRVFLLLFDAPPSTPTQVKPDTAHRQSQHLAAWEALRPHPPCYWRIAQMEVRRGCQLTAQEVKGLCQTWANHNTHEAASEEAGSSGLQSPASADFGLLASPSSSSSAAHQQPDGPALLDAHGHQLPPPPPAACSSRHAPRRASPSEMMVSRLPRLAKQHRPLASAVPSLPSPVSSLQVLGVSSSPTAASATVTLMPPPPPPRSTGNALLQQPLPAAMADRQQTPPQHDMPQQQLVVVETGPRPSSSGLFDPTSNVQVLRGRANDARQRLERAERRLVALSVQQQQQRLSSLKSHALSLVPLVLEATALSLATNRRVSYFLDITPTMAEEAQARLMAALAGVEERDLCDYLGLIRDDDAAPSSRRVLLPRLLELASQELAVSVRVQDDVTGASTHVSAEHFSNELLPRLRQSRAHMLGTGGVVGEAGCEALDHVASEDLVLGSAHVYLSRLMDGRNIIGVFPLLSHDTGACLGAVSLRLLPEELPEDGRSGYSVALEIDHVSLDRAELGLLVPPATAGEEQQEPRLLLRYVLFSEALSGTVELSARSSSARKLLTQRTPEQPGDHVSYPVSHRRELCLSVLDGPFLAYLATGALVVSLHVERPQARSADDGGQGMARAALAGGQHHRMAAAATQPGLRAEPTDRFQALHDVCLQQKVGQAALSDDAASLFSGGDPRQSQQQQRRPGELELQSVAEGGYGGGLETQSRCMSARVSTRVSGGGPLLARHSHFYSLHCRPGPGCSTSFMYMMVDVLEPVLELGVDYFNECPRHFAPVDVKRPRRHVNKSCLSSSSSSLAPSAFLQGNNNHSRDLDDDLSIDRASEMWSELDTAGGGGLGGPLQEPVFHVVANPLIRVRRLRIVLEQVEPLAPFRLESCVRVLASVFVCINERSSDGSDLAAHLAPQHELEVVSVRASPCKRRLEVTVEMPSSQALSEHSSKGERVLLAVQPLVFVEGVVQPVAFHRVVVLKVLPVRRQTSMLYSMRKSLRDPTLDRMHQVGSYVAVKAEPANLLDDAVLDFVRFRLASHQRLLERSQLSRLYQEGSDEVKARPDLTVDSWKEVLNSPKAAAADRPLAPPPPAAAALPSRRTLAPAYLDQVELQGSLDDPVARPGALKQQTVTALFGVTPEMRRRASLRLCGDGVYRVVDGAAAAGGGDEAAQGETPPVVSYAYPKGPMCPLRDWALLSHVRTEEVPDYPAQRAGFLSMRTGLLGTSWARAWFVWTRPFLFYYKGKTDRKMAGVINVTDCTITRGTDDYEMVLRGPHRKWQLQAANDDDFVQWATALGAAGPLLLGLESGAGHMMMMTAPAGMLTASQSVWSDN